MALDEPPPEAGELRAALEQGDLELARRLLSRVADDRRRALREQPVALADFLEGLGVDFYFAPMAPAESRAVAEALFLEVLELRRAGLGERHPAVAESHDTLAQLYYAAGRWREAEDHALCALRILEQLPEVETRRVAKGHFDLATIYFQQGRFSEASEGIERSLAHLDTVASPDPVQVADTLNVKAEILRAQGFYEAAEATYGKALSGAEEALGEHHPAILDLANNLAGLYKDQGRFGEAEALFRGVRERWLEPEEERPLSLATGYLNHAEILRLEGRVAEAEHAYVEALELVRRLMEPDDPRRAIYLNQLALLYTEEGDLERAEPLYREALEVLTADSDPPAALLAQTEHDYAGLLCKAGRGGHAEELYAEALARREHLFGERHPEVAWTLTQWARCRVHQGRAARARPLLQRALDIFTVESAYPEVAIEARALRAELLEAEGRLEEAISVLDTTIREVEVLRPRSGGSEITQALFVDRHGELFERMVRWRLRQKDVEAAVEFAERGRARVLTEQLAAARVDLLGGISAGARERFDERQRHAESRSIELRRRLDLAASQPGLGREERRHQVEALERELDAVAREMRSLVAEVRRASPRWRRVVAEGARSASLETIQRRAVPAKGLLLFYHLAQEASHAFLIPPEPARAESHELRVGEAQARALGLEPGPLGSAAIARLILGAEASSGLMHNLASPGKSEAELEARLHALWRLLVPADWWSRLRLAGEVVVVPDGALFHLPFEALRVDSSQAGGRSAYWLEEGPVIRYAPSATVLLDLGRISSAHGGTSELAALIVADPLFSRQTVARALGSRSLRSPSRRWLEPLPSTAKEARAVRRSLEAGGIGGILSLQGLDASEANVRTALGDKPRLVHLATHGLVDEERYELVATLALTPPPEPAQRLADDGFLELFEIYDLELPAELVVLSACETHVGRRFEGEGVFALSRAFHAAGALRVVASLWPVDDRSTYPLMAAFYRHLASDLAAGYSPGYARALRDARLELRRDERWSAPYFWAPFVLSGLG